MKKVLIASVGGSPEPIVNAIVQERPDFVYFLCSTGKSGSDEMVTKTGTLEDVYEAFRAMKAGEVARTVLTFD